MTGAVAQPLKGFDPSAAVVGRTALPVPPLPIPRSRPLTRIVVLDPGHGGKDPGTIGAFGTQEKDIALATAREVRSALRMLGLYRVVLTRDRDVFVRLRDRVAIARAAQAELFVSIHADARGDTGTRGASVYTLSEHASDTEAAALAERENKADSIAGLNLSKQAPDVTNILIDLVQRETMNRSASLAGLLVSELEGTTRLLPNSRRFAGFAVLKSPDVPSVLLELGYLSNREDESLLRNLPHRRALGLAIARSIHTYFDDVEIASLR